MYSVYIKIKQIVLALTIILEGTLLLWVVTITATKEKGLIAYCKLDLVFKNEHSIQTSLCGFFVFVKLFYII